MTQKDNILHELHELHELNSSLAVIIGKNPYHVPAGYFDSLPFILLKRAKAMDVFPVHEELTILAPQLATYPKLMPYAVPAGYFENLEQRIAAIIHATKVYKSPGDELKDISPLLGALKKQMPFAVPGDYFERTTEENKPAKVVSFRSRRWIRYAAAAVITGLFVAAGFMLLGGEKTPGAKALAGFTRDIKKLDETQKEKLIDLIDAGLTGKETAKLNPDKSNEVKELLQGVSEEELKDFQEQTEDIQDVLMTNEP